MKFTDRRELATRHYQIIIVQGDFGVRQIIETLRLYDTREEIAILQTTL